MTDPTTALREVLALSEAVDSALEDQRTNDAEWLRDQHLLMAEELLNAHGPALLSALEDARRLDWLSDRDQHIGNVMLPSHIVEANVHSLRAAIDAAIAEGDQA